MNINVLSLWIHSSLAEHKSNHIRNLEYINLYVGEVRKKRTHSQASQDDNSKRPKKVIDGNEDDAIEDTVAAQAYAANKSIKKALRRLSRHVSHVIILYQKMNKLCIWF